MGLQRSSAKETEFLSTLTVVQLLFADQSPSYAV